jgi:hypothetical protein
MCNFFMLRLLWLVEDQHQTTVAVAAKGGKLCPAIAALRSIGAKYRSKPHGSGPDRHEDLRQIARPLSRASTSR